MSEPATSSIYRPRQPRVSPLYQVIERFLPQFEQCYDDRYAPRYGPWRPVDRRRGSSFSPLRRLALRLRAGPLSGLPARNVRRRSPAAGAACAPAAIKNARCLRRRRSPTRSASRCPTGSWSSRFPSGSASTSATIAACSANCPGPPGRAWSKSTATCCSGKTYCPA